MISLDTPVRDLGPELLTIARAAAVTGGSVNEIRGLIAAGALPAVAVGRLGVAVRRQDVDAVRGGRRRAVEVEKRARAAWPFLPRLAVPGVWIGPDGTAVRVDRSGACDAVFAGSHRRPGAAHATATLHDP